MRYISPRIFVVIVLLAFVACVRAQVEEPPVVSDNPLKQYFELGLPVLEIVTEDDVEPTCDTILPPADAINNQSDPRIPTSVELVGVSKTNNDYYTISGIKANKNHKGILINKGKKIIN